MARIAAASSLHSSQNYQECQKDEEKEPHRPGLTDGWIVEYSAALISVASLAGLAILLVVSDNKPTFNWHGITINTLVALLSTTSRVSLMVALAEAIGQSKWILFARSMRPLYDFELVDRASRGSLGRLNILWRVPFGLASIGALAALLSLAFDAFAQQLVQTRTSIRYIDDASAQLPIATRYAEGTMNGSPAICDSTGVAIDQEPLSFEADFDMQSAILYGLGNVDAARITQQLASKCPSGNCTWAPTDSLAICSKCTDVRDQLTTFSTLDDQGIDYGTDDGGFANSTAFTLPNGVYLSNRNGSKYSDMDSLMIEFGTGDPSVTNTFQSIDTLIWAMSMIRAQPDTKSNATTWPSLPVDAMECGFYYCVKTYTSTVLNGVLSEAEQPAANSTRNRNSWQPIASGSHLNETQIQSIQFELCESGVPRTDLSLGAGFNISWEAVNSISVHMNSYFAQTCSIATGGSQITRRDNNEPSSCSGYYVSLGGAKGSPQWSPPVMQPLLQAQDWDTVFSRIAQSMTNSIRAKSQTPPLQGKTGTLQILVEVRWPWIGLPVAVVIAGLVQLAVSVISTRRSSAPVWKSSSLATMSRAHEASELLGQSKLVSEMEDLAAKERVEMFPTRVKAAPELMSDYTAGYSAGRKPTGRDEVRDISALSSLGEQPSPMWGAYTGLRDEGRSGQRDRNAEGQTGRDSWRFM